MLFYLCPPTSIFTIAGSSVAAARATAAHLALFGSSVVDTLAGTSVAAARAADVHLAVRRWGRADGRGRRWKSAAGWRSEQQQGR